MTEQPAQVMSDYKKHIALLSLAQCLYTLTSFAHGVYAGLAGSSLAPTPALATVPISVMIIGTLCAVFPLSFLMKLWGRKFGFSVAAGAGVLSAATGYYAILHQSFELLCVATFLQGIFQAGGQFYRFAAIEMVPDQYRSRAIAHVLAGGILAPIIGPTLFTRANALFEPVTFAGVFISLILISALVMVVTSFIRFAKPEAERIGESDARPLSEIMRQPVFITAAAAAATGFCIMVLMMTGAPIAIVGCGFTMGAAATVVQWHILGMFLPSLVSGRLIAWIGTVPVMMIGSGLFIIAGVIAWSGLELMFFQFSLLLVAIAWNFLYTAGTTMLADSYRPSEKAKVQATNECLLFGTSAVTSFLAGYLINSIGWHAVAFVTIWGSFALLVLVIWFMISHKRSLQA